VGPSEISKPCIYDYNGISSSHNFSYLARRDRHRFNSKGSRTKQEVITSARLVGKMPDSAGVTPHQSWQKSSGTVEDMRSDNLQLHIPNLVENMQSRGLQHPAQYAENIQSGGLQLYDSLGDKERISTPVQGEKLDPAPIPKRKVFGPPRRIFWLLAAILVLVVSGAVVGGVVGTRNRRSNTSTGPAGTSAISQVSITSTIVATSTRSDGPSTTTTSSTGIVASSSKTTISSSTPISSTTALPFVTPSRANPVDVDGNYFVNCNDTKGALSSGMAYYKNLVPGKNIGQQPDDYIVVTNGSYVPWNNGGVGMS
jgi:hypothetical protein